MHQRELRQLLDERQVEIFGIIETKAMKDKMQDIQLELCDNCEIKTNVDERNNTEDSIWLGGRKNIRSGELTNRGEYLFYLIVAYG